MRKHQITESIEKYAKSLENESNNYRSHVGVLKMRGMYREAKQAENKADELMKKAKSAYKSIEIFEEDDSLKAISNKKKRLFTEFQDECDKARMYKALAEMEQSKGNKDMSLYYKDKARLHFDYADVARGRLDILESK